ncbi:hypothetical protein AMTRI_Chr09g13670 [Amborella trichopoda]
MAVISVPATSVPFSRTDSPSCSSSAPFFPFFTRNSSLIVRRRTELMGLKVSHNHSSSLLRQPCTVACLPSYPKAATKKLYVSGLSFRTTEESLRNAFKNFGQLVEVNLVMDKRANRPRGFAFLEYATEEESRQAIEGMHGKFLDGRVIFVEVAKSKSELQKSFNRFPPQY